MMYNLSFYVLLFVVCILLDQVNAGALSCVGCLAAAGIVCSGGIFAGPACAWASQSCVAICNATIT